MSQDIDIVAVSNQIANLKVQRSMAMDDVAVLMGTVESLKKQLTETKAELEKAINGANTPNAETTHIDQAVS